MCCALVHVLCSPPSFIRCEHDRTTTLELLVVSSKMALEKVRLDLEVDLEKAELDKREVSRE
jgi:hypothetical protein